MCGENFIHTFVLNIVEEEKCIYLLVNNKRKGGDYKLNVGNKYRKIRDTKQIPFRYKEL